MHAIRSSAPYHIVLSGSKGEGIPYIGIGELEPLEIDTQKAILLSLALKYYIKN